MRTVLFLAVGILSVIGSQHALGSGGVPGKTDCTLNLGNHCPLIVDDWRFTVKIENVGKDVCGIRLSPSRRLLTEVVLPWASSSVIAWANDGDILTRGPGLITFRGDAQGFEIRVQPDKWGDSMTVTLGVQSGANWTEFIKTSLFGGGNGRLEVWPLGCE